jgi:protein involved in polysaccharide export with SLBB domain
LLAKNERLRGLIERAGGLTQSAYAEGIAFYRRQGRLGRVDVDLPRVLRDSASRENLVLQHGDSIHLAPFSGYVDVQGAVGAPRGVAYAPGADLVYYVRAAGGPGKMADPGRAYVTQPNGKVESVVARTFWPDATPVPKPGSVVFVPEKDMTERPADSVARLGVIAQILGSLVAIIAITRR